MGNMRFELDEVNLAEAAGVGSTVQRVMTAVFVGCDAGGRFLVQLPGRAEPVPALSVVALTHDEAGEPVLLTLDVGGLGTPAILGRLRERSSPAVKLDRADGERLVLSAEREIELRCGDASIVLTRAGKVLIRGNYVVSRSRGANRIKGAYVDIN
jgi:hypothetical protein